VVYSDLGFIVLGLLLEKLSGKTIAQLAREEMFDPLGLQHTFFNPEQSLQTGIAACEAGNQYERQMCGTGDADNKSWREEIIWGQVHDGNAYFLGGAARTRRTFFDGARNVHHRVAVSGKSFQVIEA
jgi:CubicO group peptidase (beta-lactamase class C family)